MKKSIFAALIAAMIVLTVIPFSSSAAWDGSSYSALLGDGSELNPYTVSSENDFAGLARIVNEGNSLSGKYVVLEADLDLGGAAWTPIGSGIAFSGHFDGKGHTVSNVKIDWTSTNYTGIFGLVKDGSVENLNVEGINVNGKKYSGAIVGQGTVTAGQGKTVLRNLHVTDAVLAGEQIGGIVARVSTTGATPDQIIIENCSAENVKIERINSANETALAQIFAGGIVGACGSVTIRYCHADNVEITCGGNVSGQVSLGGIIGIQGASSAVANLQNSYATDVKITVPDGTTAANDKTAVGGIIGRAGNVTDSELQNCFSIGTGFRLPSGYEYSGGVVGVAVNWIKFNNCSTDSDRPIGEDKFMQDYPAKIMKADEFGLEGAADKLGLQSGNTKAVWKDDPIAGHPVIDEGAIAENVFTSVSWDELTQEQTTEKKEPEATTEPSGTTSVITCITESYPDPTKAPDTTPVIPVETTSAEAKTEKKGCGSCAICGIAVIAVIGTAFISKKE